MSDSATLWTVALQAPLSIEFSRQEYWGGLLFPTPGDLPDPGNEPASLMSPALVGGFFTSAIWKAFRISHGVKYGHVVHHISGTYLSYN